MKKVVIITGASRGFGEFPSDLLIFLPWLSLIILVKYTLEKLSELKLIDFDDLENITNKNFNNLFF